MLTGVSRTGCRRHPEHQQWMADHDAALGTFATDVSAYEHDQSLSSSQAASLLAALERVRGMVCH